MKHDTMQSSKDSVGWNVTPCTLV